jgi:hypothetical protein
MTTYAEFLNRKHARVETPGREVSPQDVHPMLHDWQNELVRWAVRTGAPRSGPTPAWARP